MKMSGYGNRENKKHNGGFTMVEAIVVVVILLIFTGFMAVGVVKWIEWTNFKQQNEYAQTLFSAAQNQLTEYSESGQLTGLQKAMSDNKGNYLNPLDVTQLTAPDGNPYTLSGIWPESDKDSTRPEAARYQGQICYLIGTTGDYQKYLSYQNGELDEEVDGQLEPEIKALYDMLLPYLYDPAILNATVCVEFTPEDGQVFAVLYSDKAEDFTHDETKEGDGTVSISNRESKYRKARMVGYYGVDTLSKATSPKAQKPSINEVKLNNEETLNLSFRLTKVQTATQELTYEIKIYDRSSKRELLVITLDGSKLKNTLFRDKIPCSVTRLNYDADGKNPTSQKLGEFPVLAWVETDRTVRVVLDAVDLTATSAQYYEDYPELVKTEESAGVGILRPKLSGTYSFHRFGLNTDDIYCTVQGRGTYYKTTAKKQSNSEHTYFGSARYSESGGETSAVYTVSNARHLSNIRYLEDYTEEQREKTGYEGLKTADHVTYQLTQNMDWRALIENGCLFATDTAKDDSNEVTEVKTEFQSIRQLRSNAVFEGNERRTYTVSGLYITEKANQKAFLYGTGESAEGPAGLFVTNYGTLRNFALDRITVNGGENVGAFCGMNAGTLENLTTADSDAKKNPSTITGESQVGGITGGQSYDGEKQIHYKGLVNRAQVKGHVYVGGIVGMLKSENAEKTVLVEECRNYGPVEGAKKSGTTREPSYIGGIVGYCKNSTDTVEALQIKKCISSPQYMNDSIDDILGDREKLNEKLTGVYVGGIIGYNDNASVQYCSTEKEDGREGYVFGLRYVGGIVGYSEGSASGIDGSTDSGTSGINEIHVIGDTYVGGVTGCNAAIQGKMDEDGIVVPDSIRKLSNKIENWINRGVVVARGSYAGGIAGYNAGWIYNCNSDVDSTATAENLTKAESLNGDYAGGIAGYNNGIIGNTKRDADGSNPSGSNGRIQTVCYISGNNYVGGIVGYNDVDAVVEDYEVAGGYIGGSGSFVGGYAGLNASISLLMDEENEGRFLNSNPNQVTGAYCIGGTIGGNIVADKGHDIEAAFRTDNFLGVLKADAFAGGFIGYNLLMPGDTDRESTGELVESLAKALEETESVQDAAKVLAERTAGAGQSESTLYIQGLDAENAAQSKFGGITAQIHVGGVVGYNDDDTGLYIKDVTNLTPVTAEAAMGNEDEQPGRTTYTGDGFTYSYAGGIIGRAGEHVTIDNCSNRDVGDVTSVGTYVGGLCEVSEGTIVNCSVSSIGSGTADYVGGIAGVNKAGGEITDCSFENRTVTGRNYVGGFTAENFGSIVHPSVNAAAVTAYGADGNVGGITGYNDENGAVTLGQAVEISVSSAGDNVGGITGYNKGILSVSGSAESAGIAGSISGNQRVGGVVGYQQADSLSGFYNEASVTASGGDAGGIVGKADNSEGKIEGCINQGTVSATKSGNAGGMIGNNLGSVLNCANNGSVSAPNGICGGVTGVNSGTIQSCDVTPKSSLDGWWDTISRWIRELFNGPDRLTFIGRQYAGGICGSNTGDISACTVTNLTITNLASSRGSSLGGIAGKNTGSVSGCNVGTGKTALVLKSNASDILAGGIAGSNSGTIEGTKKAYSTVYAQLGFVQTDMAYYGNLGGIAGSNTGTIRYCEFNGDVQGTANNPQNAPEYNPNTDFETNGSVIYGYGGIAGVNGDSGKESEGTIENCKVNAAKITGMGDPNNVANIGGAAGVNGLGAQISYVTFGTDKRYDVSFGGEAKETAVKNAKGSVYVGTGNSTTAYGHTGGVAGFNSGSISDICHDGSDRAYGEAPVDEMRVIVENYRGHVGGIVGYNRKTGSVQRAATGSAWAVYAPQSAQDNGCGGIVGYSASREDMLACINRATVEKSAAKSNAVGGMVGRMECADSTTWRIKDCVNYGKIRALNRVGGMIGVWKYYGGTISDCINYGEIYSTSNEGAAGMVGMLYQVRTTAAQIVRCENHGTIRGTSYAGGIAGRVNSAALVQLRNCVNTGLIQPGDSNGGIVGELEGIQRGSYITACNNYGYAINGTNIGGIIASNYSNFSNLRVTQCFGIGETKYPVSLNGKLNANYYLTESGTYLNQTFYDADGKVTKEAPNAFYVTKLDTPGIDTPAGAVRILYQKPEQNGSSGRAYYRNSNNTDTFTYEFTFSTAIDLRSIDLYWNRDKDERMMEYKVYTSELTSGETWNTFTEEEPLREPTDSGVGKEVVSGAANMVRRVKIEVTKAYNNQGKAANICLITANFNGTVFGFDYSGENGYAVKSDDGLTYGPYKDSGELKANRGNSDSYWTLSGLPFETYAIYTSNESEYESGTGLNVTRLGSGGYQLTAGEGADQITVGIPGFSLNPLREFRNSNKVTSDTSLAAMGSGADNIRYQVFEADNDYFNAEAVSGQLTLGTPAVTSIEDSGNAAYKAVWTEVKNASFYRYEAEYRDARGRVLETRTDTVYDCETLLPVSDINGTAVEEIRFSVWAGAKTLDENGDIIDVWSSVPGEKTVKISPILPSPQYHLELVRNGETLTYQIFLDNRDEYLEFLKKQGKTEEVLGNIEINVNCGGSVVEFTAQAAKSESYFSGNDTNTMFTAQATSADLTFTGSAKVMRESQAPVSTTYTADDTNIASLAMKPDTDSIGFRGITPDTLSYQLKIGYTSFIVYMRSEMVADDVELGVPVVLSTSQLRTSDTTDKAVATSLSSLPREILEESCYQNLMVRSYPALMSNNVVYTGHAVDLSEIKEADALGVEKTELTELYVTEGHGVTTDVTDTKLISQNGAGGKTLAGGYAIELASDGTYTIYYNALLEYNAYTGNDYSVTGSQSKATQVFYYRLTEERTLAEKPVIRVNDAGRDGTDGDPNEDTMVITWDLNHEGYAGEDNRIHYKEGAVYDYVITGFTPDGTSVQIDAGSYTTKKDEENSLTYDTTSWNYQNVAVSISRHGEENAKGMTTVFPSINTAEYKLKTRLTQIPKPVVSLHRDEDGKVEKNTLVYDVTWDSVPPEERSELDAYEITAERSAGDTAAVFAYEEQQAFTKALDNAKALYAGRASEQEVLGDNSIRYTWKEADGTGHVTKTMVLSWMEDADHSHYEITKELTGVWIFAAPPDAGNSVTQTIDLNDYERGEVIDISVKAIAAEDARTYRSGVKGVVREMTLPSRLDVPDVTELTSSPVYYTQNDPNLPEGENSFITRDELTSSGISLILNATNVGQVLQGKYEFAAAVYGEKGDEQDTQTVRAGDGEAGQEGYWNSGALATLVSKASVTSMDGNFNSSNYVMKNISAEYAGKWLKIAMRSISDSNVSSLWSDEDDVTEATVNYQWLRIPRVQVTLPELTESRTTLFYLDGEWKRDPNQSEGEIDDLPVTQTSLTFDSQDYADGYRIQMIQSAKGEDKLDPDKLYSIYDTNWLWLEKCGEGEYHVFYQSTEPEFDAGEYEDTDNPVCSADETAAYLGTITQEHPFVALPYTGLAQEGPEDTAPVVNTASCIMMKNAGFELVLPDAEVINTGNDAYSEENYLFTGQTSVQAYLYKENLEYREPSAISNWYRGRTTENVMFTDVTELQSYGSAPSLSVEMAASALPDKAYEITSRTRRWLVYQLAVTDSEDNLYVKRYLSAYGEGTSDITTRLLLPEEFAQFAGRNLRVRIASIDGAGGNLSEWTEWMDLIIPPAAEKQVPAEETGADQKSAQVEPAEDTAAEDRTGWTNENEDIVTEHETESHRETEIIEPVITEEEEMTD